MIRDQSREQLDAYRRIFYQEVIKLATEVNRRCFQHLFSENDKPSKYTTWGSLEAVGKEQAHRPHENERQHGGCTIQKETLSICESRRKSYVASTTRSLIMLVFDESQFLTDLLQGHNRTGTLFTDVDNVLHWISILPTLSLFASKAGGFYESPPKIRLHPSVLHHIMRLPPLSPIAEVGFDDLAYGAMKNTDSLERVLQTDQFAHLGRPAYIYPSHHALESCLLHSSSRFGTYYDDWDTCAFIL
jgi:hypothetical protein